MKQLYKKIASFVRQEQGGEVMEYAIVLGLISVTAIALIASFGTKVVARWASVNSSI